MLSMNPVYRCTEQCLRTKLLQYIAKYRNPGTLPMTENLGRYLKLTVRREKTLKTAVPI